jgi:superfamily II DNA or RNA helicase
VEVDALPQDAARLRAWAERYGVLHELIRPAREALPGIALVGDPTLAACCLSADPAISRGSLLREHDERELARAHLIAEARRQAALPAREALWQCAAPEASLRMLSERLRALLGSTRPAALAPLHFVPARPVTLSASSGVCVARLRGSDDAASVQVKLYLSGFEQRALSGECSVCKQTPCLHVRALAGRLLDGCLWPEDRLHAALQAFAGVPSWQRFFAELEPSSEHAGAAAERLSFALRMLGDNVSVGVLLQTTNASGHTLGRLLAPRRALARACATDRDRSVLEALIAKSRTLNERFCTADLAILRSLVEHPNVLLDGTKQRVQVVEQTLEVRLLEQPDGLLPRVLLDGAQVHASQLSYVLRFDQAAHSLCFAALAPALARLLRALAHFRGVLPKQSYPSLASFVTSLQGVARVVSPKVLLGAEQPSPRRLLLRITPCLDEGIDVQLCVRAFALSGLWPPGSGPELVHGLVDGSEAHTRRDLAWERSAAQQVIDALELREQLALDEFRYRVAPTQAALCLLSRAARKTELLEIEWAERSAKLKLAGSVKQADLKVSLFKKGGFLLAEGALQSASHSLALGQLLDAARRSERFVRVGGEDYLEIEASLFDHLARAELCVLQVQGELRVPVSAARFWLENLGDNTRGADPESQAWLDRASTLDRPTDAALEPALVAQLRGYQRAGVAFLLQRASWAPGACLADEMGLGKTVQTIALLCARAALGAALVVAPTSLIDNWREELSRFAPSLTALVYRGAKRSSALAKLAPGAVLLVSYELLLRDREQFTGLSFATQVVDEAQVVKNGRSLRARAVASIDASFRVALSGTPLENRLGDLWSLFQLLAPALLGSWPRFRARFAVPIERYDNRERARALRALIAPFLLRRTKDEVEKELPARTEVLHLVELSRAERQLYASAVQTARRAIGKRKRHDPARGAHILAELTRLRQLACHPRLVLEDEQVESSKLHALLRLLDDILPRGHRALIFSQFTAHLALIREALSQRGISLLSLDGSTPATERARLVDTFQQGAAQVFLISLKAGGTGLNLTAADYVVHMDPWWNPSAEDQAGDRVHRIGQLRPVTIVKLVARDTIEERVLALHAHKRRLAQLVFERGESEPVAERGIEELLAAL